MDPFPDGAGRYRIQNIQNIFKTLGHEVDCLEFSAKNFQYPKEYSCTLIRTNRLMVHLYFIQILRKKRYDLIHANTCEAVFFSITAKLFKIPILYDKHGDLIEEFKINQKNFLSLKSVVEWLYYTLLQPISDRVPNHLFCVSRHMIQYLNEKRGIQLKKMHYITNGVDLTFFKEQKDEEKWRTEIKESLGIKEKCIVGYIGGFQKWQGIETLPMAADLLRNENILFLIVGAPKMERKGNILYLCHVPREEIPSIYRLCDLLLLPRPKHPATEIAAPTKLGEYAASGRPLLVTDVGDAADLIQKYDAGLVISNNSPSSIAEGIKIFLKFSEEKRRILGLNALNMAELEFDWDIIKENIRQTIEDWK
jgi:glycosyltransferase involved in cell wall biosynthesis